MFNFSDFHHLVFQFTSLICSTVSSNPLLVPSSMLIYIYIFGCCIFQLYLDPFYIFNSVKISTVFIHSSPKFFKHLYDHYLEFFLVNYWSPLHLVLLLWFYLLPLEHIPLSPHFTLFTVLMPIYLAFWLHFPILDKCLFVEDLLSVPAAYYP